MINSQVFTTEMAKLAAHFKTEFSDYDLNTFKEFLSEALDTQEFVTACSNARRNCKPHPSFIPSCEWLIDSVLGTLEERAVIQFQNLDRLSMVGRQALEAIGGFFTVRNSERPELLRKDFIANYLTFAKNASPDALRMPENALPALNPVPTEKSSKKQSPVTLNDKMWILRCRCNFEKQRPQAWAEAKKYGFTVNMSPHVAENQRITLASGQNPNEILDESIEDFEASVRSLTSSLAGKTLQPLGF